jgi:hypothetical protein
MGKEILKKHWYSRSDMCRYSFFGHAPQEAVLCLCGSYERGTSLNLLLLPPILTLVSLSVKPLYALIILDYVLLGVEILVQTPIGDG